MTTDFYFIRHGETELNRQGIVQGSGVDSDLNDLGRAQAHLFYQKYQHVPFDLVIISTLKRTAQTAHFFLEDGTPSIKTALINEIHWGEHEGKPPSVARRADFSNTVNSWRAGDYTARTSNGESAGELAARLTEFKLLVENLDAATHKNVLVVSHGRTLRVMMCVLCNEPLSNMEHYEHSNTGLFLLQFNHLTKEWTVLMQNYKAHLETKV
jgi:broad specificity phosphatase PhoE